MKIAIIRLSAIGDVINTLPASALLKRHLPEAKICWIVEDKACDIVKANPDVDEVIVFQRRKWLSGELFNVIGAAWQYIRKIKQYKFDIAIDFQGNLKGGIHTFLTGASRRIGFAKDDCKEFNYIFSNEHIALREKNIHRLEKFKAMLSPLGINSNNTEFKIEIPKEAMDKAKAFLWVNNYKVGGHIVIHSGTSKYGAIKRWALERYAKLADEIIQKHKLKVLLSWGGDEFEGVVKLAGLMRNSPLISFKTNLAELGALIKLSRLFIGSDSGPMHLASALGTPVVALFGPKSPVVYGPYNKMHKVVYKENMNDITVEDVLSAVENLLK